MRQTYTVSNIYIYKPHLYFIFILFIQCQDAGLQLRIYKKSAINT